MILRVNKTWQEVSVAYRPTKALKIQLVAFCWKYEIFRLPRPPDSASPRCEGFSRIWLSMPAEKKKISLPLTFPAKESPGPSVPLVSVWQIGMLMCCISFPAYKALGCTTRVGFQFPPRACAAAQVLIGRTGNDVMTWTRRPEVKPCDIMDSYSGIPTRKQGPHEIGHSLLSCILDGRHG